MTALRRFLLTAQIILLAIATSAISAAPALAAAGTSLLAADALDRAAIVVQTPDGPQVQRAFGAAIDGVFADAPDVRVRLDGASEPYRRYQWGTDAIHSSRVLPGERGVGVTVAVVDSGIDASHPDLAGRIVGGTSVVGADPFRDELGHGTAVAGVIAADADNRIGIAGIADGVDLLSVQVVDADGISWASDVAEGILWAVDNGADIINVSLTTHGDAPVLRSAVLHAVTMDVAVIASAGNRMAEGNPQLFPAAYEGVTGVAALDRDLSPARFASAGAWVDIAGPGVGIFSTATGGEYDVNDGASFATPHVAAAAALLLERDPGLDAESVIAALSSSAIDLEGPGRDDATGHGLVSIGAAIAASGPTVLTSATPEDRAAAVASSVVAQGQASHAVVVSATSFPDALSAAGLAGVGNPILLAGSDGLSGATQQALSRALPAGAPVFVLGGASSVPSEVEAQIAALGLTPQRIAGASRIETAIEAARQVMALTDTNDTVFLAKADGWADAIAAGAVAAAQGAPILLTGSDSLHPAVRAFLAETQPQDIVLLGGTGVLGEALASEVGPSARRVAGASRQGTALAVATALVESPAGATIVDGFADDGWVDGLLSAPLGLPILLADSAGALDTASAAWLADVAPAREVRVG